jgi:hypothetical protein
MICCDYSYLYFKLFCNILSLVMLNYPLLCNYPLSLSEGPSARRKGVTVMKYVQLEFFLGG